MIDIHSHIVYGVDDGPETLEESLALLAFSYEQGVRQIVSTSHRRKGMFETPEETIFHNFCQVKQAAVQQFPDLQLFYGGELYFTPDILDKLEKKEFPSLNNTRFALIEFSMTTPWKEIHTALNQVLMLGITPVIAHIERYDALANKEDRVKEVINMGCYTQINSIHVLKAKLFGDKYKVFKKRASYFLEKDLVHCVASDMHNLETRPPYMAEAYQVIAQSFGKERADVLFNENPSTLLDNRYI